MPFTEALYHIDRVQYRKVEHCLDEIYKSKQVAQKSRKHKLLYKNLTKQYWSPLHEQRPIAWYVLASTKAADYNSQKSTKPETYGSLRQKSKPRCFGSNTSSSNLSFFWSLLLECAAPAPSDGGDQTRSHRTRLNRLLNQTSPPTRLFTL